MLTLTRPVGAFFSRRLERLAALWNRLQKSILILVIGVVIHIRNLIAQIQVIIFMLILGVVLCGVVENASAAVSISLSVDSKESAEIE